MQEIASKLLRSKVIFLKALMVLMVLSWGGKAMAGTVRLSDGDWYIRPCTGTPEGGEALSLSDSFEGWTRIGLPSTVLGGLCQAGVVGDIFFDDNLSKMDPGQFGTPWWFCTTFDVENFDPDTEEAELVFEGINYRADVWLNGRQIMSSDKTYGAYRIHSCNVTGILSGHNRLAVKVAPPEVGDFYMGFVDWAPAPPDHNMGIFRPVLLRLTGKVSLGNPYVRTDLDTKKFLRAGLTVQVDVTNHGSVKRKAVLEARLEGRTLKKRIRLRPGECRTVVLSHSRYRKLRIHHPRVWWPNGLGAPEMYSMSLSVSSSGVASDQVETGFGIRKVETYMDSRGVRGYKVNGRPVLIKGAGFCDDLFLRNDRQRYEDEIRYVKEMGLNCLRLEGIWGTGQDLYDLCDRNGILLMLGWSCQWEWPDYLGYDMEVKEEDQNIAIAEGIEKYGVQVSERQEHDLADYFESQVKWLRNHPSIFVWVVGSDGMPKASLEEKYSEVLARHDPDRSLLVSAGDFESSVSGRTGMKMNGPYDYVAPVYWYEDKKLGGAFGFNTEVGPGPQVPLRGSLEKMIPESRLWPYGNPSWTFHSGQKNFASMEVYLEAIDRRYGPSSSLDEFEMKAQWINYEAVKAMFEAHVVNRPQATGVIQWQLNSAWPELYWQLYDWYLMPTGAYFGTKKGCQVNNVIYNYFDRQVYVCNDGLEALSGCKAGATLYDSNSSEIFSFTSEGLDIQSGASLALTELPRLENPSGTYFLKTSLEDSVGNCLADNFYWLSGQEDEVDWDQYFWCYSPTAKFADFKELSELHESKVLVTVTEVSKGCVRLLYRNESDKIAFCLQSVLSGRNGEYITPVYWSDNYFSLLGGETKEVTVEFPSGAEDWTVAVEGVNVRKCIINN